METILTEAKANSFKKINLKKPSYVRFLRDSVLNSKDKIKGIYGSRGVGKTTLMLQIADKLPFKGDELIYISCDHLLFSNISLFKFIELFVAHGGKCILIDEIHEAKNFEQQLKSVYDFLQVEVIFSGSSAIKLTNASFSRRYAMFKLPILSLKEYCELSLNIGLKSFSLNEIINHHQTISSEIVKSLANNKILKLFNDYLKAGAYPYYFTNPQSYEQKITDSINTILWTDIALLHKVSASNIAALKKLLLAICLSKPLELSINSLAKKVGISKVTLYKYIDYLHRAELLRHVLFEGKRFKVLQKPDKLYLSNTNLFSALCLNHNRGTMREAFFASQVAFLHSIYYLNQGDFLLAEKYTIEIGGKNKGFEQVKGIKNACVVIDDIEISFNKKIPLWLFGFLY